jgi:predicted transcriptional regulator
MLILESTPNETEIVMPRRPRKSNLLLTDVELALFRPFWENGRRSLSASDVQLYLMSHGKNNAYTTVKTMIDRMVKRGIFSARESGGRFYYTPKVTREQVQKAWSDHISKLLYGGSKRR